jgi:hypothetical protein
LNFINVNFMAHFSELKPNHTADLSDVLFNLHEFIHEADFKLIIFTF